jgi:RNA polymerase sigma-70 factor, ECF subfamily
MHAEKQLIQQIAEGDEKALKELFRLYYPRLVRFLLRVTNNHESIVEIINDVFLVVWQSAHKFRGQSSVSTWILGIAYKKGLKAVSKQHPTQPLDESKQSDNPLEEQLIQTRDLCHCVGALTPEHRAVVELTYYFGYSYKEISDILGCPENTVKTRMFYARQKLRSLLEATHDG